MVQRRKVKQNSLPSSLIALCLLLICVLGCSKLNKNAPKSETIVATSSSPASHSGPVVEDIAGSYNVEGMNGNGSPYRGSLEVIKRGDVYQFRWNTGKRYDGVGISVENFAAVAFTEGTDGKGCGVASYRIAGDGTLDGKWGYWGMDHGGTEKAERTSGSGVAGQYSTVGTNPDGKQYTGTLSVGSKAGGYTFAWGDGSTGFGVERGDNVSVGIGGTNCAFVAYEIKPGGVLDGVWGGYGSERIGREKATKK